MRFISISVLFVQGCLLAAPTNSVTVSEIRGITQNNRPFTVSRVFAQGEIPNYPQPVLNGTALATWQADVKTRWPDGSVQHALVSLLGSLSANSTIAIAFANNPNPCSSGNRVACDSAALNQQQMLDFNTGAGVGSWGARLDATASGNRRTADVRTILGAGKWSYWLRGPVVTQTIVEDRTPALSYDFGWQCTSNCTGNYSTSNWVAATTPQYNSLHPIFVTTFYTGYPGVKVEYIVENVWSKRIQDQRYAVTLYTGNPGNTAVFSNPAVTQWGMTRWRQTFWSGATPNPVKIDYNLPYMAYSRVLPNFDLTKSVTTTGINAQLADWAASDKGAMLAEGGTMNGLWTKYFPQTGGRPEIGLFPTWVARYLYTFHTTSDKNDLYNVMLANGEVSGYVPMHVRDSEPSTVVKYCALSQACTSAGLDTTPVFGRSRSRDAYPTTDPTVPVAPLSTAHGWTTDTAHQGSFAFIPYLITGDWYFLEELNFWSASNLFVYDTGTTLFYQGHADWVYILDQIRGQGWVWRNLGHAAFFAPDGTPEKAYFRQKLLNNIAIREGKHDIRDGYGFTNDNVKWQWGYTRASAVQGDTEQTTHVANPINIGDWDQYADFQGIDTTKTKYITAQWQVHMLSVVLGHLNELGFPVTKYKEAIYKNNINQLQNPAYNRWNVGNYRSPAVMLPSNTWAQTFAEMKSGFLASEQTRTTWETPDNDPDSGYVFYARAAATFAVGLTTTEGYTGLGAYNWITANNATDLLNENPKWAFSPRAASTTPPPPVSLCDLDENGVVDANDVTIAINQALGKVPCSADINGDGRCSVLDVQRIIVAALGGICRVGL